MGQNECFMEFHDIYDITSSEVWNGLIVYFLINIFTLVPLFDIVNQSTAGNPMRQTCLSWEHPDV
jgi:hypothetical protein